MCSGGREPGARLGLEPGPAVLGSPVCAPLTLRVGGGHRPELGRFAGARVLECVAGAWKCWFEAGKLTVKFNCCLRGGAQAVRSARVRTSRGCLPLESQTAPRPGQRHTPPPDLSGPAASPPPVPLSSRCGSTPLTRKVELP